ncbi:2,3-diaminopropionate biosynthesis protein SbnA [Amycolatopsis sp. CA-126428]|uniref:2,3-diaminopropionate biosynthesis protein SbnA n=1 Tax=Amycolatopsis sp. CA-126428 TaxID=2073158 RepID=UPI000CD0DE94|nr:2,3-diaminopropionate biosynthesis protein SbnA [Amycolatopsis sp. CA-126428]
MPIVTAAEDLVVDDVYVDLRPFFDRELYLKCENFNFAGSVKLKAARSMVDAAERAGVITPDSVIVESSSGNLGIALAMLTASRGYRFVCVIDPRANPGVRRLVESMGGEVVVVTQLDEGGGYLGSRIRTVQELCENNPGHVWLNQYANDENWRAHYRHTAPALIRQFPSVDYVFIGAGTAGTLMGCARYLKDVAHKAKVVAVDSAGSVTFGGAPSPRFLPGIGTSRRPELVDESVVDDVVVQDERGAVQMCHRLAGRGFLFGASTGTVLSAAERYLKDLPEDVTAVAISPDLGDRYLDTLYDRSWVEERFPGCLPGSSAAPRAAEDVRMTARPLPAGETKMSTDAGPPHGDRHSQLVMEGQVPAGEHGATVWLTGLPSAGKTTVARMVAAGLRAAGHRVEVLDGDEFRAKLSNGLGFSREDRDINVDRVGWVAQLLARNGVKVLVPVIAPYADARAAIREQHLSAGTSYREVHVATPVEVCSARDTKGLYAKQCNGEISGLTGVDDPYEVPRNPDLRLYTHEESIEGSAARLLAEMKNWGLL